MHQQGGRSAQRRAGCILRLGRDGSIGTHPRRLPRLPRRLLGRRGRRPPAGRGAPLTRLEVCAHLGRHAGEKQRAEQRAARLGRGGVARQRRAERRARGELPHRLGPLLVPQTQQPCGSLGSRGGGPIARCAFCRPGGRLQHGAHKLGPAGSRRVELGCKVQQHAERAAAQGAGGAATCGEAVQCFPQLGQPDRQPGCALSHRRRGEGTVGSVE